MKDNSQDYFEELLLNPKPGTAAAAARDYGIDLTLTVQNLRLSFEDRIRRNDSLLNTVREMRAGRVVKKPRDTSADRVSRAFESAKEYLRVRDQKEAPTRE